MKSGIHPKIYSLTAKCSCGNAIETISTSKELQVHICSACHPFYSGKQKILDTAGRVERFKQRYAGKPATQAKKGPRTVTIQD